MGCPTEPIRMTEAIDKTRILRQLQRIRVLRWLAYGGFFSAFVGPGLLYLALPESWQPVKQWLISGWVIAGFLGSWLGFYVDGLRCPRCGECVFLSPKGNMWDKNPFSSRCRHCGLKLDGSNLPDTPPPAH